MEQIVESITEYGLNTVIIAFLINAVTAIFKIPIKILAKKLDDYTKVTRFIVFLPIMFGFILTFCYEKYIIGNFIFNREFVTLWLTSSSLSLTFYAIYEKLFPAKKALDEESVSEEQALKNIKKTLDRIIEKNEKNKSIENLQPEKKEINKIILKGKNIGEVKTEK